MARFKRELGVTHKQAHAMLNVLIKQRTLVKMMSGGYELRRERR
jgi:hypothetical protein